MIKQYLNTSVKYFNFHNYLKAPLGHRVSSENYLIFSPKMALAATHLCRVVVLAVGWGQVGPWWPPELSCAACDGCRSLAPAPPLPSPCSLWHPTAACAHDTYHNKFKLHFEIRFIDRKDAHMAEIWWHKKTNAACDFELLFQLLAECR